MATEGAASRQVLRLSINTDELLFLDDASILCVGGYQLIDPTTQRKRGLLSAFKCDPSKNDAGEQVFDTNAIFEHQFNMAGVFQLARAEDGSIWVALSDGTVEANRPDFSAVKSEAGCGRVVQVLTHPGSCSTTGIATDFEGRNIVSCYSSGTVAVWDEQRGEEPSWCRDGAHSAEAWQVHVLKDPTFTRCFLSGGDDAVWCLWDTRQEASSPASLSNPKFYSGGVTSFANLSNDLPVVSIGSYDESLAVWDLRSSRAPLASVAAVGGGIWRQQPRFVDGSLRVLAACMHGGWRVFEFSAALDGIQTRLCRPSPDEAENFPHALPNALAYGAAWIGDHVASGCSFYDNTVSIFSL